MAKMTLAIANARSLPMRRATTPHTGAAKSAGAISATNSSVTAASECSTQVATYCAPASMSPVARACSTKVASSARKGALRRSARMLAA